MSPSEQAKWHINRICEEHGKTGATVDMILPQLDRLMLAPNAEWYISKLAANKYSFFVGAGMLGWVWASYRKMYGAAIAWAAIFGGAFAFLTSMFSYNRYADRGTASVIAFVLCVIGGGIYTGSRAGTVVRRIHQHRLIMLGRSKSLDDLMRRAKRIGGQSMIAPLAMVPVLVIGMFFGLAIFLAVLHLKQRMTWAF